jgi:uncharacterized protein
MAPLSSHKAVVETYIEGFRRSDHQQILSCLTEDVVWELPGYTTLTGKEAFDKEINNPAFVGRPTLELEQLVEEGDCVVALGHGEGTRWDGQHSKFVFSDVFTFTDDRISRLQTYLVMVS